MLQQTTVAAVKDYFARFIGRWPTVHDLAAADLDEVLAAWAGLGYYARARNLHKCAGEVVARFAGRFPESEDELLTLPGIGRYTAAAISSIAFQRRAVVMDGNVERVISRLFRVEEPLPDSKPVLYELSDSCTPDINSGDHAQAMMDLGATICIPRSPKCILCPLSGLCEGRDVAAELPHKKPKAPKPSRAALAYWLVREDGAVLFRRRAEKGLLGGMLEVPSSPWVEDAIPGDAGAHAPFDGVVWMRLPGTVRHVFTHFSLEMEMVCGRYAGSKTPEGDGWQWHRPETLSELALPSVMMKLCRHAIKHGAL